MEKDNFYLIATSNSRKFPKNTPSNFEFELDEELDLSGCQVGAEKVRFQSVQKNIGDESIVISEKRIKRKLFGDRDIEVENKKQKAYTLKYWGVITTDSKVNDVSKLRDFLRETFDMEDASVATFPRIAGREFPNKFDSHGIKIVIPDTEKARHMVCLRSTEGHVLRVHESVPSHLPKLAVNEKNEKILSEIRHLYPYQVLQF